MVKRCDRLENYYFKTIRQKVSVIFKECQHINMGKIKWKNQ